MSHNVYFYSSKYDPYTQLTLLINDRERGGVPYSGEKITFENDSLDAKTIMIPLRIDQHPIALKDQYGYIKTDGILKVKRKSHSSSTTIGVISTLSKGNDIIVEFSYN